MYLFLNLKIFYNYDLKILEDLVYLLKPSIMLYQLPNGRVIRISVEQYLDLTDDDIAYLCNPANNIGAHVNSLWTGSILKRKKSKIEKSLEDTSIDHTPESEEIITANVGYFEEEYLEDLPDMDDIADESTTD